MDTETLRVRLYRQLADEGRVASSVEIAAEFGVPDDQAAAAFLALAEDRHIVLDARGEIALAHPFATRDFGFSVKSDRVLWWGGCAWDSFAIPHLLKATDPVLVATRCPSCGTAHAWNVNTAAAPAGDQVAHFLVPMEQVWNDVIHACENQRIFCNEDCVTGWLDATGARRGSVFDLEKLWRLASDWYTGRLDRGYRRRDPSEAASYFRGAGLVGDFWGNATRHEH
jgi:hypothetical protein